MIKMTDKIAINTPGGVKRTFIRHPTDIPIEVRASRRPPLNDTSLHNLSLGGIAFSSDRKHRKGQLVNLRIPLIDPGFEAVCKIMWCRRRDKTYEVGARFTLYDDLYRLRMVEQVCHIEHYRRQLEEKTNRKISADEAAQEWIAGHAEDFPSQESLGLGEKNIMSEK